MQRRRRRRRSRRLKSGNPNQRFGTKASPGRRFLSTRRISSLSMAFVSQMIDWAVNSAQPIRSLLDIFLFLACLFSMLALWWIHKRTSAHSRRAHRPVSKSNAFVRRARIRSTNLPRQHALAPCIACAKDTLMVRSTRGSMSFAME